MASAAPRSASWPALELARFLGVMDEEDRGARRLTKSGRRPAITRPDVLRGVLVAAGHAARHRVDHHEPRVFRPLLPASRGGRSGLDIGEERGHGRRARAG